MDFFKTEIPDILIIKPKVLKDNRGFFLESYRRNVFKENCITTVFVQDNHSYSSGKGVLRGFHFQAPPFAQAKLVRVIRGKVYDVVLDIRKKSKTFGQWKAFELSSDNFKMIFIPEGFAHGFCTMEAHTEIEYKVNNFYSPEHERGIRWNDPDLDIDWPVRKPVISEKDANLPFLSEFESPF